ncbi:MAG: TIGR04255 family protein [Terriglobia bacterium]
MTFPETDREIYKRNPLEFVVCQLKFPPILEISAEMPARFQNIIRERYPFYVKQEQQEIPKEILNLLGGLPFGRPVGATIHKFLTEDQKRSISLSSDFIAYQDRDYSKWESFSKAIQDAQHALEDVYRPAFYTRIGLRYRDIINPRNLGIREERWQELLKPSLIGMLGAQDDIGTFIVRTQTEASFALKEVDGAMVTLRHGIGPSPPSSDERHYYLDLDSHTTTRREGKDVIDVLNAFNRVSGYFFRWAITPELRRILGPEPIRPR